MPSIKKYSLAPAIIVLGAFIIRFLHLLTKPSNPRTYHPGTDEAFYIRFGENVAQGGFGLSPDFVFMDPLYGYILGIIFFFFKSNIFIVYLSQIAVDTTTTWLIYLTGKELKMKKAGIIAALVYSLTSTAIFYSATILKPTFVAFYVTLWVYLSLRLWRSNRHASWWLGYGIFLGLGVALRSNLLPLAIVSMFFVPLSLLNSDQAKTTYVKHAVIIALGTGLVLAILAYRNSLVTQEWKFLPPNGGVVLHQMYNHENPDSHHAVPSFVSIPMPLEILKAYHAEAESRLNKNLDIYTMSKYWQEQAIAYIVNNPVSVIQNILRKSYEITAYKEVANNRALNEGEYFSPVLQYLPRPFTLLLALGLPGLILLSIRQRRTALLLFGLIILAAAFVVFFPVSRLRFPLYPLLAIGVGVSIQEMLGFIRNTQNKIFSYHDKTIAPQATDFSVPSFILISALVLTSLSILSADTVREDNPESFRTGWAWGYIKMGEYEKAKQIVKKVLNSEPENYRAHEISGYINLTSQNAAAALVDYTRALAIQPDSHEARYNLAVALEKTGNNQAALDEITKTCLIYDIPEYRYKKAHLLIKNHRTAEAMLILHALANPPMQERKSGWQTYAQAAKQQLAIINRTQ